MCCNISLPSCSSHRVLLESLDSLPRDSLAWILSLSCFLLWSLPYLILLLDKFLLFFKELFLCFVGMKPTFGQVELLGLVFLKRKFHGIGYEVYLFLTYFFLGCIVSVLLMVVDKFYCLFYDRIHSLIFMQICCLL